MLGLLILVLGVLVMAYGFCYMVGGQRTANRYASGVRRVVANSARGVGRGTGRAATANPLAAGIVVLILMLVLLSRC